MAETYKVLAQHQITVADTFQTIYTVPTGASVAISSVHFLNTLAAGVLTYRLAVVKAADTGTAGASVPQFLIPLASLIAQDASEIVGGITLSAGDQLRVMSNSTGLTVHVYGVEFS